MAAVSDVKSLQSPFIADYKSVRYEGYLSYITLNKVPRKKLLSRNNSLVLLHRSTYVNNSLFHRPSETGTTTPRDK